MSEQQLIDMIVLGGMVAVMLIGFWLGRESRRREPVTLNTTEPFTHVRMIQTNDRCPRCQGWMLEGDSIDYEGNTEITQTMWCLECEAEWMDVYTISMRMLTPIRL